MTNKIHTPFAKSINSILFLVSIRLNSKFYFSSLFSELLAKHDGTERVEQNLEVEQPRTVS